MLSKIILLVIIIILAAVLIFFKGENAALKKAISQYEQQLKQKEEQIATLQGMIDSLMTKQVRLESQIKNLKKEKEQVKVDTTDTGIVKEFENFGIKVRINKK